MTGRVWAGHNVERFDSVIIREAFDEIGRPPPQPRGMIDTLPLLTQRFGRRAGDMKVLYELTVNMLNITSLPMLCDLNCNQSSIYLLNYVILFNLPSNIIYLFIDKLSCNLKYYTIIANIT